MFNFKYFIKFRKKENTLKILSSSRNFGHQAAVTTGKSRFKLFLAKMFYRALNALSDVEIPLYTGDFRLVDRKVVDVINIRMPEHKKFLIGLFSWLGHNQKEYKYERQERFAGKTKYPF